MRRVRREHGEEQQADLVFSSLGVEDGKEHVAVTVAFGAVCSEDVAERRRGRTSLVEKRTRRGK